VAVYEYGDFPSPFLCVDIYPVHTHRIGNKPCLRKWRDVLALENLFNNVSIALYSANTYENPFLPRAGAPTYDFC